MSKIKEIKKIESPIKEIPKKVESIDDEFDEEEFEEAGNDFSSVSVRRFNKTSTLDATEGSQSTPEERSVRVAKKDRDEIDFRPSYVGGGNNSYQGNNYKPVGSAEATDSGTRNFGERNFEQDRTFQNNKVEQQQSRGEINPGRTYVGEREQDQQKKDRRRDL
ncbi:MAG: hypothetical protein AABX23_01515 [Nanoarchaeota archaeon]